MCHKFTVHKFVLKLCNAQMLSVSWCVLCLSPDIPPQYVPMGSQQQGSVSPFAPHPSLMGILPPAPAPAPQKNHDEDDDEDYDS